MASATMMGLRRRAPVNSSPTPSSQSPSTTAAASSSSKRSRSENNNSPSHGNLNSMNGTRDEPPTKKSRGTSTSAAKAGSACPSSSSATCSASSLASSSTTTSTSTSDGQSSKSRGTSVSRSATQTKSSSTSTAASSSTSDISNGTAVLSTSWPTNASNLPSDVPSYASVTGLGLTAGQTAGLCAGSLGMPPTPIPPYMSTSMATFVGNATNLGKSSSVSYLDISNMTSGSLAASGAAATLSGYAANGAADAKTGMAMSYTAMSSPSVNGGTYGTQKGQGSNGTDGPAAAAASPRKFQNDTMFNTYQPWVIKTYGDLAKTKTITIKKYARILRTLRGEEVNSAENSKFRFWVKSKGFHIGQPEGYDAKPADRIIGRHAVTSPGLDPPLYVPTQLPHNKVNTSKRIIPPAVIARRPSGRSHERPNRDGIKLASVCERQPRDNLPDRSPRVRVAAKP
ncbi:Nucleolar protein [Ooceraea biroi]|uniref:Nucleolar protein n=1 Tax=Ooceraea biroi TaxID=2015173 RepID=A0A026WUF9_OOCBI|nr:Nucleolar protein [Ooceraea biroi]